MTALAQRPPALVLDDVGVVDDRLRDGHPLLLPAGELRHPPVGIAGGADPLEGVLDAGPVGR